MTYTWQYVESFDPPEVDGNIGYLLAHETAYLLNPLVTYFALSSDSRVVLDVRPYQYQTEAHYDFDGFLGGVVFAPIGTYTKNLYYTVKDGGTTRLVVKDFWGADIANIWITDNSNIDVRYIREVSDRYVAIIFNNLDFYDRIYSVDVLGEEVVLDYYELEDGFCTSASHLKKYDVPTVLNTGGWTFQVDGSGVIPLQVESTYSIQGQIVVYDDLMFQGRDSWQYEWETGDFYTHPYTEHYTLDTVKHIHFNQDATPPPYSPETNAYFAFVTNHPSTSDNHPAIATSLGELFTYSGGTYNKIVDANQWDLDNCPLVQAILAADPYRTQFEHIWHEDDGTIIGLTSDWVSDKYYALWQFTGTSEPPIPPVVYGTMETGNVYANPTPTISEAESFYSAYISGLELP
jgi:hypothetical protein